MVKVQVPSRGRVPGPARGRAWSMRHREEQQAYCTRFVLPVIAGTELRRLGRADFARVLDAAPSASVAAHLRRGLSTMGAAGLMGVSKASHTF